MTTFNAKTRLLQLITVSAFCLSSHTRAAAETASGVLQTNGLYFALFSASPESGGLIGHSFKNNYPVGKTILAKCLSDLVCKV